MCRGLSRGRMLRCRRVSDNVLGLSRNALGLMGENAVLDALIDRRDCVGSFCRA
jgi:hypothetical protein